MLTAPTPTQAADHVPKQTGEWRDHSGQRKRVPGLQGLLVAERGWKARCDVNVLLRWLRRRRANLLTHEAKEIDTRQAHFMFRYLVQRVQQWVLRAIDSR